jgi:ankyrin repeat protein
VVRLLLQHLKGRRFGDLGPAKAEALWHACRWGHTEIARALLMAGAEPTFISEPTFPYECRRTDPLQAAVENGHYDVLNLLEVRSGAVCTCRIGTDECKGSGR